MKRVRRTLSVVTLLLLVGTLGAFLYANYSFFRRVFKPQRLSPVAAAELLLRAEEVRFKTTDGIELYGNFIKGRGLAPAIVFCHDRGAERNSVLPMALLHNRLGYGVLIFDFRAHGASGGEFSTLGIREREDVLAAVRYLESRADVRDKQVGVWGVGMGAYAAILGASETDAVRALALNFLYSDSREVLREEFEHSFHAPMGLLEDPYMALLDRIVEGDASLYRPHAFIDQLMDRSVLFVVAQDRPDDGEYVTSLLYRSLDSFHRSLIRVRRSQVPTEGSDREGFEINTVQFFKESLPL